MENYYEILGVQMTATVEEIKKRYRELVKEFHPDKNSSKEAEERIKQINAAYETLSDIQKRQQFDYAWQQRVNEGANVYSFNRNGFANWSPATIILVVIGVIVLVASVLTLSNRKTRYAS